MIFTNNFSPVFFEIGAVQVHWYGLTYALGIVGAYLAIMYIFKKQKYPIEDLDSMAIYLFVGMVVGARLGHVFFYEPSYYLAHPIEILQIWKGGLASHGGAIGVFLAYWLWAYVHEVKFSKYPDVLAIGIPILSGFIRLGNFFNSEIAGYPTNGNWGVVFAKLGETFPRHPVQLYAVLMNWLIFAILFVVYKKYYKKTPQLFFMFLFFLLYFGGRFILEYWKDLHGPISSLPISMGQLLSVIPILAAGIYFAFYFPKQDNRKA